MKGLWVLILLLSPWLLMIIYAGSELAYMISSEVKLTVKQVWAGAQLEHKEFINE